MVFGRAGNMRRHVPSFGTIHWWKCHERIIFLIRRQNLRKPNISYPLICTHYVCVLWGKKCYLFGKFCARTKLMFPIWEFLMALFLLNLIIWGPCINPNPKKSKKAGICDYSSELVCLFVFNIFPSNLTHFLLSRGGRQDIYQKTSITIVLSLLGNCGILNKNV